MLIAARGNPHLPALSDSPVKLVASVIRAWWGEGERRIYYPIKQLWCWSNKKFQSIPARYRNLALSAWKKFILSSIRGTKKRRRYFPAVNLEELIDRRQSLVTGYCQGAVVILTYIITNLLFTCNKTCAWARLLNPSRWTLKYDNK